MFNKIFFLLLFSIVAFSAQSQNLKLKPINQVKVGILDEKRFAKKNKLYFIGITDRQLFAKTKIRKPLPLKYNLAKEGRDHSSIRNKLVASIEILPLPTKGIFESGIEWKINKQNGLGLVGGITVGNSNPLGFSGSKLTRQGFKVQPFYRHYWHKNAKRSFFMELNAGFYRETFTRTNDWYRKGDFYIQYDAADAVKKAFYGHFIMGKRYRPTSRLSFDIYGGVGAKLVNIEYEATKTDFINKPILAGLMSRSDRNAGKTGMPSLVIGARVNFAVIRK